MSVPQFKEVVAIRIDEAINAAAAYLIEQHGADLDRLRFYQGQIAGLRQAQDIISDYYRQSSG